MSWNIKKVGQDKEKLKAAVQVESMPDAVKARICAKLDVIVARADQAIIVLSHGHYDTPSSHSYHKDTEETEITLCSFVA